MARPGNGEELNLAQRRLGLEDFVRWIKREFMDPLANLEEPLEAEGVPVGPKDKVAPFHKSIVAKPTDFTFRDDFAGNLHRKEWRSVLAAFAYLAESGKVRAPARPGPSGPRAPAPAGPPPPRRPGAPRTHAGCPAAARPRAAARPPDTGADSLAQLAPGKAVSFADGEGSLSDFFLDEEPCQVKSLQLPQSRGSQAAGLQSALKTKRDGEWVPYDGDAFQHLILVYWRASRAYIWSIPMDKLKEKGLVTWDGKKGKQVIHVHMSEADAEDHPNVCQTLKKDSASAWTEEFFKGVVDLDLRAA